MEGPKDILIKETQTRLFVNESLVVYITETLKFGPPKIINTSLNQQRISKINIV